MSKITANLRYKVSCFADILHSPYRCRWGTFSFATLWSRSRESGIVCPQQVWQSTSSGTRTSETSQHKVTCIPWFHLTTRGGGRLPVIVSLKHTVLKTIHTLNWACLYIYVCSKTYNGVCFMLSPSTGKHPKFRIKQCKWSFNYTYSLRAEYLNLHWDCKSIFEDFVFKITTLLIGE